MTPPPAAQGRSHDRRRTGGWKVASCILVLTVAGCGDSGPKYHSTTVPTDPRAGLYTPSAGTLANARRLERRRKTANSRALAALDRKCPERPQELIYEARQILDDLPAGTTVGDIIRGVNHGVTHRRADPCLTDFHAYRQIHAP